MLTLLMCICIPHTLVIKGRSTLDDYLVSSSNSTFKHIAFIIIHGVFGMFLACDIYHQSKPSMVISFTPFRLIVCES